MAEAFVEDLAVRARHVEHTPTDRALPGFGLIVEPLERLDRRASLDHVDQLRRPARTADVHDRGAPLLGPPLARAVEQRLIQTKRIDRADRSEEHTSEPQSLMRISYAVFCLKK